MLETLHVSRTLNDAINTPIAPSWRAAEPRPALALHSAAPITVLQVIPDLDAGGAERTTIEVAEALSANGHTVLVASRGGRMVRELETMGANARWIQMPAHSKNPLTMVTNAMALAKLIRDNNVDIVHARSRAPAWSALWAARRTGARFVTTYHGAYGGRSSLKQWYNGVMARGDYVIANSEFIGEHIRDRHDVGLDRLRVIPRGVNLAAFAPDAVSAGRVAAMRNAWGLKERDCRPVFLLPGRLTRWKGQTVAVNALASLRQSGAEAVLVLAGDDQGRQAYVEELETQISRSRLDECVRIAGHCEDMPAAYRAADFVLAPSVEPEAFGRVAAEAQCTGRLVIAADHGGQRETVDPRTGGWLVAPGDPRSLAKAMAQALALETSERAAREGAAMARARERYSTSALQIATLAVYAECVASRMHA